MLLTGAAEAVAEAESVQTAVAGTAAATEESNAASAASAGAASRSSREASRAEGSVSRLGRAHQFLGKAAMWGAGILGVGSVLALKAAYDHTQALGLATQKLSLQTGMNTRHASKWVEITEARNISATQLSMGFSTLAKQQASANQGTSTSIDLFKRWGIGQKELRNMSSEQLLNRIADAFNKVHTSAGRAARAADIKTLFGRSGTALLPLLSTGSKGIAGQLGQAGGIDKDQLKQIIAAKAAMRELGLEVTHLKDELAVALIPVILGAVKGLLSFVKGLEEGKTWAVAIAAGIGLIVLGLGLAAVAWVAVAAAEGLALGWPVLAIALIAAGFYLLYTRVDAFRTVVDAVFGFFKAHWPLLVHILFPFLVPLALIVKHFHSIKSAAQAAFNWIKGAAGTVAGAIKGAFSGVAGAVSSVFNSMVHTVVGVINWLINAFNAVFDRTIDSGIPGVPVFHGMHIDPIGGGAPTTSADVGATPKGHAHGRAAGGRAMHKTAAPVAPYEPPRRGGKGKGKGGTGDVWLDKRKVGVVMHDWAADEAARA
jgi:hypothetical protein